MIAPNPLHLITAVDSVQKDVIISAQNCSLTGMGAFTGEISIEHLKDIGISWTLTGHSERRAYYAETDDMVAKKTKRAVDNKLRVIACCGETLAQRKAGNTMKVVQKQLTAIKSKFIFKSKYQRTAF